MTNQEIELLEDDAWQERPFCFLEDDDNLYTAKQRLNDHEIGRVARFDELDAGILPAHHDIHDELTLWVVPMGELYTSRASGCDWYDEHDVPKTRRTLRCSTYDTSWGDHKPVRYFHDSNLILCLYNPFSYEKAFEALMSELDELDVECVDARQVRLENWKENVLTELKGEVENLESDVESQEYRVEKTQKKFEKALDNLRNYRERLEERRERLMTYEGKAVQAIRELEDMDIVERVELDRSGKLTFELVGTPVLTADNITVGKYEKSDGFYEPINASYTLKFPVEYQCGNEINVYPTEDNEHFRCHPHVGSSHNPCMGTNTNDVNNAYRDLDFKAVVKYLYSWERTYNKSSPMKSMQSFYDYKHGRKTFDSKSEGEAFVAEHDDLSEVEE